MANCFTIKNKLPKVTTHFEYPWHKLGDHNTRKSVRFDLQWGGRQNYPGTTPFRPFIDRPEMRFNPPPFEDYRVLRMPAMLKQINFCNWTCSGKVQTHETRDKPLDIKELPKSKTTVRHYFKDYSYQRPPESCEPPKPEVLGTLPGMITRRYTRHPLYTWPDWVEPTKDKSPKHK